MAIKITLVVFLILILGVSLLVGGSLLFQSVKTASNTAHWQLPYKVLARVIIDENRLIVKNVRDFRYADDGRVEKTHYFDKEYLMSDLTAVWYGVSHFGKRGMAHVFLSFEFEGDDFLALSIEARLQERQQYNPLKGLFGHYTKTVVVATERDVLGLRTHIRSEPVYLYPLNLDTQTQKAVLMAFVSQINALHLQAEFYNTFSDNCMTGLLDVAGYRPFFSWFDYRIILPGFSDRLAYKLGLLNQDLSLEQWRKRALVDPSRVSIENENYSVRIRDSAS